MPRWLLFAAWLEDDPALHASHWFAQQTAASAPVAVTLIERAHAVRSQLEAALDDVEIEGIALFGHGVDHAVMGSERDHQVLDGANIGLVGARRVHAMACNTGRSLVPASASDVALFVGYKDFLVVPIAIDMLPAPLQRLLARVVTAVTLALMEGVVAKRDLKWRARQAADELNNWIDENTPTTNFMIQRLAETLVEDMVVSGQLAVVEAVMER